MYIKLCCRVLTCRRAFFPSVPAAPFFMLFSALPWPFFSPLDGVIQPIGLSLCFGVRQLSSSSSNDALARRAAQNMPLPIGGFRYRTSFGTRCGFVPFVCEARDSDTCLPLSAHLCLRKRPPSLAQQPIVSCRRTPPLPASVCPPLSLKSPSPSTGKGTKDHWSSGQLSHLEPSSRCPVTSCSALSPSHRPDFMFAPPCASKPCTAAEEPRSPRFAVRTEQYVLTTVADLGLGTEYFAGTQAIRI